MICKVIKDTNSVYFADDLISSLSVKDNDDCGHLSNGWRSKV